MCGIAGVVSLDGAGPSALDVERMISGLGLRGPDGKRHVIRDQVALGHARLKIIDLSDAAAQPMLSPEGGVGVTYNGEIYNFRELRKELERDGFTFASQSDTEVVLHGYRRWGIRGVLERADGMFAFALHDRDQGRLFLCRDRFGEKPLYYCTREGRLRFASEIRPIHEAEASLTLDQESLDYYLVELSVPQPRTIWREVSQVPPAHFLEVDLSSGQHRLERYWSLAFGSTNPHIDAREAEREVERLLRAAVVRRTVSDVPIGAFLSGGMDSGLVVAYLADHLGPGVKTFTVSLAGLEGDEAALARPLAQRYATDHHEIVVEPSLVDDLPAIAEYFGEPFGDSSAVPTFYVSRAIGRQVKVALSGDGGDEIFGGYHDYLSAHLTDEYLAAQVRRGRRASLHLWRSKLLHRLGLTSENLGHYAAYSALDGWQRLQRHMGFAANDEIRGPALEPGASGYAVRHLSDVWHRHSRASLSDTLSEASLETRLLNDYLVKVDRMSMMSSVEVRAPFLDRALAEFVAALPGRVKYGPGRTKYLLRRLAVGRVAGDAMERAKMGFGIPVGRWLRGELQAFATEALLSGRLRSSGLVRVEVVRRILREHMERRRDHSDRVWALLMLELWLDRFLR